MEPLNSKVAEQRLSQLCAQLETCLSIDDVQKALSDLDASAISRGQAEMVLHQLLATTQVERLTELVLTSGGWARCLSDWLLETFPTNVDQFLFSIHLKVIEKLSLFLTLLPHPFGRESAHLLRQYRIRVELTPKVMSGLTAFPFEEQGVSQTPLSVVELDEPEDGFIRQRIKQSVKKQTRKAKHEAATFSLQDLEHLGIEEPHSRLEADATAHSLLVEVQKALQKFLSLLHYPDVASTACKMFVVEATPTSPDGLEGGVNEHTDDTSTPQEEPVTPVAYPYIQPMKASLYFENPKGFGDWRVLISTRADRDLRDARRRDRHTFEIYIKKIKELSEGHFSTDNQKRLNGADLEVPLYEAKMTGNTRLVYQIDCVPEYGSNSEKQVIKVFGIFTHAQINRQIWSSMGSHLARKGKEYRRRCTVRKRLQAGDNVFYPESFPPRLRDEKDAAIIPELPKEDLKEIHSLLVLEKFVTLSKELGISILADLNVAHVFDVTPQEKEIIEHPYSCYVLGRSGTGKTTTMLFKMLGIERAYGQQCSDSSSVPKPRQLFVTQSRVLASRVEEYFSKLLDSLAVAKKTNQEIRDLAEKKRLLQDNTTPLYHPDDDVSWQASLPQKFSLLQDEHFPLFLTFERLVQLLENDIDILQPDRPFRNQPDARSKSTSQLVGYHVFLEKYWPHFPNDLTKNLDPALVFSELLGVIEGSEESLSHESRYLDQASYCNLSHRAQHIFAKQRDRIYNLFDVYKKHKQQYGDSDSAERTHNILKAFEETGIPGTRVDFLYVDEAQDNLLVDVMLLRSLCRNPNGLFWAGDTAQTIAIGSSFRFNDLKAFLHRLELRREGQLNEDSLSGATQTELRTFQLTTNYRSHGGIVRCASSVIELITHFWPYAIDTLAPEEGVVDGAKPVFFSGWDSNTVQYEHFLSGDSGERIEFGARQCILVRDEAGKTEVRQRVGGNIGLVLTLYESKGLEFDDVLLYKFFEDSKVGLGQWRIVLHLLDPDQRKGVAAPWFDEGRHAGICAELKCLYVAITRSRNNLWIIDCSEKAEPMKMLWESKGLIQTSTPGSRVPQLAAGSSREEWATTAHDLFAKRIYLEAAHAFERAAMDREATIAHAHHLRETAGLIPPAKGGSLLARQEAYRSAAQIFSEFAELSIGDQARVFRHNAGGCFEQAGDCGDFIEDYRSAAEAYEEAREYNSSVMAYRKGDMLDEAAEVVRTHAHEMDPALVEDVLEVVRLFHFGRKDYQKARSLFNSVEEELGYLKNRALLDECHADVLAELGRYQESADIHIKGGRTIAAVQVLLKDGESQRSTQRANDHFLRGLWQNTSFSMKIKDRDTISVELLSIASKLNYDSLSLTQRDEIAMFRNIRANSNDGVSFKDLGYEFLKRGEKSQALLCFDHLFMTFKFSQSLSNAASSAGGPMLEVFYDYCHLFREIVMSLNLGDSGTQKLFNLCPALIENAYRIRPGTWLHRRVTKAGNRTLESDDGGVVVASANLLQTLKNALWQRLSRRLSQENQECRALQLWTPCLPHVMDAAGCPRLDCPRQHLRRSEMTQTWFNDQLRGICLQILVYDIYLSIPAEKEPESLSTDSRRYWIHRLHETMRPSAHCMGSQVCFNLQDIGARAKPALDVAKRWCLGILQSCPAERDIALLSSLYEATALCLLFDRPQAIRHLQHAPLLASFATIDNYCRLSKTGGEKVCVVRELCQCLQANDVNFIDAGIRFLQHVVFHTIPVDLNLLCHFIEFLVGSLILAQRKFSLHNLTLPRGWLLFLLRHTTVRAASIASADVLMESSKQLLCHLLNGWSGSAYLLLEGRDLGTQPELRVVFISRVCRALGLIGYNSKDEDIRQKIVQALKVVDIPQPHHTFECFVGAQSWDCIAAAVESSYSGSKFDDLVELCSMGAQIARPKGPPVGVRRVFFKTPRHALEALARDPRRTDSPEFAANVQLEVDTSVTYDGEENELEDAIHPPEADASGLVVLSDLVEALPSAVTPLVLESIAKEQKAVAKRLLAGYRRSLKTRNMENAKTRTQKLYDSFYFACLNLSQTMDWVDDAFYKKLYLGPIPHLLTCVGVVQPYAQSAKKKTRPRLLDESERDTEGLKRELDDLSAIHKSSTNIRKQLDPSSSLHKERNVEKLKQLVGQVQELLNRVPSGHGLDVQFHLDIAIKGIVTEKKVPKPSLMPELNVEDLDDIPCYISL